MCREQFLKRLKKKTRKTPTAFKTELLSGTPKDRKSWLSGQLTALS